MLTAAKKSVLSEALGGNATGAAGATGQNIRVRQVLMVVAGIAALTLAAKVRVPMWPVPMTLQTLAVLLIGTSYGARLGVVTLLGYVALGAAGVAVFAGDAAGLAYLAGPTGGYLAGFVAAAALMGALARRGWDRGIGGMAAMMLIGSAVIYALGLGWMSYLFAADKGMGWVLQMGMLNFLAGDALKLVLAALVVPGLWKMLRG